jgi:hypothetical protein
MREHISNSQPRVMQAFSEAMRQRYLATAGSTRRLRSVQFTKWRTPRAVRAELERSGEASAPEIWKRLQTRPRFFILSCLVL